MSISPSEKVLVSIEDGIAIVTINNPAANTWDLESLPALKAVVNELSGMANVRTLIITGQGLNTHFALKNPLDIVFCKNLCTAR